MGERKHRIYYLAGAVSLVTFLVYLKALQNGFVDWDDNFYVTNNAHIRSLDVAFLRWAFLEYYSYNWHPLTWMSHALDYALYGLDPYGHHLTSVLVHACNTFLVVLLVKNLFSAWRPGKAGDGTDGPGEGGAVTSVVTGLLFGIHPIHVESVAWIAERKDLLSALFFLLSVLSYVRYARLKAFDGPTEGSGKVVARKEYLLALSLFVLALLSKPMAVTLPLVLFVIDYFPFRRFDSVRTSLAVLPEKLPFVLCSIGSSVITYLAQRSGSAVWEGFPLPYRMLVAAKALAAYLLKLLLPVGLMPFYPYPRDASPLSPEYLVPVLVVIAITSLCIRDHLRNRRFRPAIWAYYVFTLIPVLGIIQVGGQFMADRYAYMPSVGPLLAVGLFVERSYRKLNATYGNAARAASYATGVVVLLSLVHLTTMQIGIWRNGIELWSHVIAKEPTKVLYAYYNRAAVLAKHGRYREAIEDYSKVIALNYQEYAQAYLNRGLVYLKVGDIGSAVGDFRKACEQGSDFGCRAAAMYGK